MNALSSNDCSVGNNGAGGVLACGVQGSALANVNLLSSNDCHSGAHPMADSHAFFHSFVAVPHSLNI
ncbi:hypothetical protein PCASD_24201 [Puccinia coronata f. sp. avenae]|uniref:Uncharacterized protein n=1 Tax=Puccinia coronata f. sp. avenae TaxID=200324 RepID=A0A2N5SFS3_9BASI|nr:hypothetical protein PCASD_24201 [Puccinia coronata f. sp. avenae]